MVSWWRRTRWKAAIAVLIALAFLAVSGAAVIPGQWHDGFGSQGCNICRAAHLPTLAAIARAQIPLPGPAEWHARAAAPIPLCEPVFSPHSPRAPPA